MVVTWATTVGFEVVQTVLLVVKTTGRPLILIPGNKPWGPIEDNTALSTGQEILILTALGPWGCFAVNTNWLPGCAKQNGFPRI